jgi:hypothetical protein
MHEAEYAISGIQPHTTEQGEPPSPMGVWAHGRTDEDVASAITFTDKSTKDSSAMLQTHEDEGSWSKHVVSVHQ